MIGEQKIFKSKNTLVAVLIMTAEPFTPCYIALCRNKVNIEKNWGRDDLFDKFSLLSEQKQKFVAMKIQKQFFQLVALNAGDKK